MLFLSPRPLMRRQFGERRLWFFFFDQARAHFFAFLAEILAISLMSKGRTKVLDMTHKQTRRVFQRWHLGRRN
jgi:hypothetical protein